MEETSRAFLLYARLVDLHRRKTEAELTGYGIKAYDALIELYEVELAELESAEEKRQRQANSEAA
jgi:hypothetical protein